MNIKENRAASFAVVAIIYALVSAVGVAVYFKLPFAPWLRLLISDCVATAITFAFSLIFKNASVYDPYWSVQPIVILAAFASVCRINPQRIILLVAVLLWGVRLTANWAYTFKSLNHQDWRYTMLKERTGKLYPLVNFLGIHMVPTLIVYATTLPCVFVMLENAPINAGFVLSILISLLATALQTISDYQMHSFKKNGGKGFIRVGLWKHSRHPNYLGEILMWWGVGLSAVSILGFSWYLLIGALLNTVLFFAVSIPMADKKQSAKDGFDEYKRDTRMLLPIRKPFFNKNMKGEEK